MISLMLIMTKEAHFVAPITRLTAVKAISALRPSTIDNERDHSCPYIYSTVYDRWGICSTAQHRL